MTMGPAPMMRMDLRSVRLGMNVDFAESWGRRNTRQAGKRAGPDHAPAHAFGRGAPQLDQAPGRPCEPNSLKPESPDPCVSAGREAGTPQAVWSAQLSRIDA